MTAEIFKRLVSEYFLPSVKKHQDYSKKRGKVILSLDNFTAHIKFLSLNQSEEFCRVIFLPPNVTSLMQSMD